MNLVRQRSVGPLIRNLGLFFTILTVIFLAVFAGQFPDPGEPYVTALSSKYYYDKGKTAIQYLSDLAGEQALITILKMELPVLALADENGDGQVPRDLPVLRNGLNLLAGVKLEDPLTYLKAEIPMMDVTPVTADSFDETGFDQVTEQPSAGPNASPPPTRPGVKNLVKSEKPVFALYNTHTSETFELTDGLAHLKGKAGGVASVAREIQQFIRQQYGLPVVYAETIHDLSFNKSYAESQKTVSRLLNENPGLQMLLDIHRDGSLTREQTVTKIDGQAVAKILLVVGTDARAEHPRWRDNLELARKVAAKMDAMYPGLSRGISIQQGRYNQQLSPKALLVEVGSAKNTTEEAKASGRLFANVVVAVLNDLEDGKNKQNND